MNTILCISGISYDPQLEDVDIQFHASCIYICNYHCWGLTGSFFSNIMKHSFIKIVIATMGMLLSAYTNANERINGIDYVILSSTDRTAAVSENISASGNVTIPSKITISGVTYKRGLDCWLCF